MSRLYTYIIFHCNLAFSCIPGDDYPLVIERCYWPLLELSEAGIPVAIEATGYTLQEINRRDPHFIRKLRTLWAEGRLEFIGSGYSQIIMPLVPGEVNTWNLELGNRCYKGLLGQEPKIVLVNEQTYSRGLPWLYKRAGYQALIMDWNNCYQYNHYPKDYLYYPQIAISGNEEIAVIWNHSIAFQKFQRAIHREIPIEEYLGFLFSAYDSCQDRAFVIYGNDAEVFDYRPGEELPDKIVPGSEHARMKDFLLSINQDQRIVITTPGRVLAHFRDHPRAYHQLRLESPETPVVCKKQEKYNPTRWALSGRDSVHINTECHRILENLRAIDSNGLASPEMMEEFLCMLCLVWGSDFRTNTIDEKFLDFQNKLGWLRLETERLLGQRQHQGKAAPLPIHESQGKAGNGGKVEVGPGNGLQPDGLKSEGLQSEDGLLRISTGQVEIEFLRKKGLAIKSAVFPDICKTPLLGTLAHGYFEDIHYAVDFFSGHLIHIDRSGQKTTDLSEVIHHLEEAEDWIRVSVKISLSIGVLWKEYKLSKIKPEFSLTCRLKVKAMPAASLRLGIFTIIPEGFNQDNLWVETINGGFEAERFYLKGHQVDHDAAVSQSVSASGCLSATQGWVAIGDGQKVLRISSNKSDLYSVPMLHYHEFDQRFFLRLYHSVGEIDETAYWLWRGYSTICFSVSATLS